MHLDMWGPMCHILSGWPECLSSSPESVIVCVCHTLQLFWNAVASFCLAGHWSLSSQPLQGHQKLFFFKSNPSFNQLLTRLLVQNFVTLLVLSAWFHTGSKVATTRLYCNPKQNEQLVSINTMILEILGWWAVLAQAHSAHRSSICLDIGVS